jgi:hypothetical protein
MNGLPDGVGRPQASLGVSRRLMTARGRMKKCSRRLQPARGLKPAATEYPAALVPEIAMRCVIKRRQTDSRGFNGYEG